eukprot:2143695-Rhodomonas_salina.2
MIGMFRMVVPGVLQYSKLRLSPPPSRPSSSPSCLAVLWRRSERMLMAGKEKIIAGGEIPDNQKDRERRAFKACLQCAKGKRQCDNQRPCGPCSARGLECKEKIKEVGRCRLTRFAWLSASDCCRTGNLHLVQTAEAQVRQENAM